MKNQVRPAAVRRATAPVRLSSVERLEARLTFSVAVPAAAQVNPGFTPGEMLADPNRNNVYVLDQTGYKVIEVDTSLGRKVAHASVADQPTALAINPEGTELYVSSRLANSIQVFALPDLTPLRTLDVSQPGRLAVGTGSRVFVAGTNEGASLRQVDGVTGNVVRSFGSYYSALPQTNLAGTKLYVSEVGLSTTGTDEYDIANPAATPAFTKEYNTSMSNGRDSAVDEKYNRVYGMSGGVYGVQAVDRATNTGKFWPFSDGAAYGASISVNEGVPYLMATSQDSYDGGVFKFDRATGTVLEHYTPAGSYKTVWDVALTPNGNALYRSDPGYSGNGGQLGLIGRPSLAVASIPNALFSHWVAAQSNAVTFDAAASSDYEANSPLATYTWDFGDGTTGTGIKPTHTYATAGKFVVKLTVADAAGNTDDYIRTLTLTAAPVAAAASVTTDEETPVALPLPATDPDNDPLSYWISAAPAHGKVQLSGNTATYLPAKDFFGVDRFTYAVSDGGRTSSATVTIRVKNVNDAPTAVNDLVSRSPNGSTTINVLGNDLNPDADALTLTANAPAHGTAQVTNNRVVYTPEAGYTGVDSFTYAVSDGQLSSTATVTVAPQSAALGGEWTTYGGGSAHAGYFPGTTGAAAPTAGWSLPAGSSFTGQPIAVADGRLYTAAYGGEAGFTLIAYNVDNGKQLWKHVFTAGNSINPPTYYNGRLYLARGNHSGDTQLWAIDATNGNTIWSAPFSAQWESYYAPAVDASGIWINGGSYGGMYGFTHAGKQITFKSLAQYDEWTPSILNGSIYAYAAGSFVKYNTAGTVQWTNSKPWSWNGYSMNRTSALAGNQAFLVGEPDFYSVDLTTGQTLWTVPGSFTGTPAVQGGIVYALQGNTVKAFATATGALVNTFTATAALQEQPLITDDSVIAASGSATYVFDRSTAALRYSLPYGGKLSLANNKLVIVSADGAIRTFDFASPLAADAGTIYHVTEGAAVTLGGTATSATGAAISAWEWDFDYDGTTFTADATGQSPSFSAADFDGPDHRRVALRVRDASGQLSPVVTADVLIDNAAPTARFSASIGTVPLGNGDIVGFNAQADAPADVAAGFRYSYDLDNDGTFEITDATGPSAQQAGVPASYLATVGPHTVCGRITDQDGGYTDYTTVITVTTVTPPTDPATLTLEAEAAAMTGGTHFENTNPGFAGTGYADFDLAGSAVAFAVNRASAGQVSLAFRYANGGTVDRPLAITVNDQAVGTLSFPPTGNWTTWKTTTMNVTLAAGANTIVAIAGAASGANVDSLTITAAVTPPAFGSLSGFAFDDADKDGVYDSGENKAGGKTVFLDLDNDAVLDSNEKKVTTASDGSWNFAGLAAGTYHVRRVFPSGYSLSTTPIDVNLAAGQALTGLAIGSKSGVTPPPTGNTASISGSVFNDNNKNGKYDSGDGYAKGVVVFLDADNDGKLDSGETSVTTDGGGKFNFTKLTAGTYRVRRVMPSGYAYSTTKPDVTLAKGQAKSGVLIGTKKA